MSNEVLTGTVVKAVGGVFTVKSDRGRFVCFSPKKLRYRSFDVTVGDKVEFCDLSRGKGVILQVLPRKNLLMRPEVANVDVCLLVLASVPKPDLYLADKVLVNCFRQGIEPVIVVNKMDIDDGTAAEIAKNYDTICDIVALSALNGEGCEALEKYLRGKTACFAGQSAVGKTSILNALLPGLAQKTGGISQKSGRGTHTTRHTSLHEAFGGLIADTCGFSLCAADVDAASLRLYLDDFMKYAPSCRFSSCTHTAEPDCAVKQAVQIGDICKERYERYVEEYNELLQAEKHKY